MHFFLDMRTKTTFLHTIFKKNSHVFNRIQIRIVYRSFYNENINVFEGLLRIMNFVYIYIILNQDYMIIDDLKIINKKSIFVHIFVKIV